MTQVENMQGDNAKLKQYLLAMLSESETEELDLRVISDRDFAEVLSLAEHELIEDHLEDSLAVEETAQFQSNFLVSPKRRAMLREISLLKEFTKKKTQAAEKEEPLADPSVSRTGFFGFYLRPILAAGAIACAVVMAVLVWNFYSSEKQSPLEMEYAELNKEDLTDQTKLTGYYPINLISQNLRDTASASVQDGNKLTDTVLFQLALPSKTPDGLIFKTKIRRVGVPDFKLNEVRLYRNPNGSELRLLAPKAILQKGQYQIIVESNADGSVVGTYLFNVD